MIHVAPCSCELHVRIRELEAELDEWKRSWLNVEDECRSRTEELSDAYYNCRLYLARAEKAEAELETRNEERREEGI